jgi:hypothetical protein
VKNWFQSSPFKFNLHRYNENAMCIVKVTAMMAGLMEWWGSAGWNQVDP